MGGHGVSPTYENYTTNNNFSETVRLEFNPAKTSYSQLLAAYWSFVPDPTQPPWDAAYALRIFAADDEQFQLAQKLLHAEQLKFNNSVTLTIWNASDFLFWKAEEYHQQYFKKLGYPCGAGEQLRMNHCN